MSSPPSLFASLLAIVLCAPRLHASSVDPALFGATLSPGAVIGLDTNWVPGNLQLYTGLSVGFSDDELVSGGQGARLEAPLHERWITTVGLGLGLLDRLELQLGVPLHAYSGPAPDPSDASTSFGIGDLRASVRARLLQPGAGFGLGLQLAAMLPTGGQTPFSGGAGLVLDPRVVMDWRDADGIALTVHLGYRWRSEARIRDLIIDDELRFGAGVELPVAAFGATFPLTFLAELEGALGLARSSGDGSVQSDRRQRPLEARLGLRLFGASWAATLAGGAGLTQGYGAPDFRFLLGFTFTIGGADGPRPMPHARVVKATWGPEPTFPSVVGTGLVDLAVFDEALRSDPDPDGDGVLAAADSCPDSPEDRDGFSDDDGCPDPDNDGDGVLDAADRCPAELEVFNGREDDDGCADTGQTTTVVIKNGVIELPDSIEFNSGSDVLARSATPLIVEVALVLKANPQIKRIKIEGHTDADGDDEMNVDLSERRAARVRERLVELGVDPMRLLPRGYGATRSLTSNDTPQGRRKNRRVEFRIIDPPPAGAPHVEGEVPR